MTTRGQKRAVPRVAKEEEQAEAGDTEEEESPPMENEEGAEQSDSGSGHGNGGVDCSLDESTADNEGAEVAAEHEVSYQLTPYVGECYAHLQTLRKRKREQEERVETLVEETFHQIESMMHELMRGLQERHAVSHAQFQAADAELTRSLNAHNTMEKKLKMIAAILTQEECSAQGLE